jgi:uncharacterized protein (DUF924 family)
MGDHRAREVLEFWFDERLDAVARNKRWFAKDASFDAEIRRRFLPLYEAAASGRLAAWLGATYETLALVIVLDQFPRNMFRGEARAFTTDRLAREAARALLPSLAGLTRDEQLFALLPFEHSESLDDQNLACDLMKDFDEEQLRYALRHRDIIRRFGRFPHRNAILGRASSAEEIEFLKTPGSGF